MGRAVVPFSSPSERPQGCTIVRADIIHVELNEGALAQLWRTVRKLNYLEFRGDRASKSTEFVRYKRINGEA